MSNCSHISAKEGCYQAKAYFFDSQVQFAWAAAAYSEQERSKIFHVLAELPDLWG